MRRLPIFFVLDCSESMVGDNVNQMEHGLQRLIKGLRADPSALESVFISVIAFAGIAKTIVPLIEIASFYPPKLPLGGGTSLGAALETLMSEIDKSVVKTTSEKKGDWKPIVYLFTDGRPTDTPNSAIDRWLAQYDHKATLIAVGLGRFADYAVLKRLTEQVIVFEGADEEDFKKFINWVTASVVAQSKSVGESVDRQTFPILDESVMRLVKYPPFSQIDEACVTLVGRCQKTRKPYLIKYDRIQQNLASSNFNMQVSGFELTGCYPLEEDYFAWTALLSTDLQVNTTELIGSPGCPHCGSFTAFAVCGCGKLMCINDAGEAVCPWCETQVCFIQLHFQIIVSMSIEVEDKANE